MISAQLNYRESVPKGITAIQYAKVDFPNNRNVKVDKSLNKLFRLVEGYKYQLRYTEIEILEKQKSDLIEKINKLSSKERCNRANPRVIFLKPNLTEETKQRLKIMNEKYQEFNNKIKALEDDLFYETGDLKNKFKNILINLGFEYKYELYNYNQFVNTENFEYNGTDDVLIKNADDLFKELDCNLKNQISLIKGEKEQNKELCL